MDGIATVEYSELASFGNFQNVRIGGTAYVRLGEAADERLRELRDWVQSRVEEYVSAKLTFDKANAETSDALHSKRIELSDLECRARLLRSRVEQLAVLLKAHGVECGDLEIPF